MGLYKAFKTSEAVETEGVTLDYGDGDWVRIARAGGSNKAFQKAIERVSRKYKKQIQLDALPANEMLDLMMEIYADTIVLDFHVTNPETGKLFPPGKESCLKMFTELPDFFHDVRTQASELALFRESLDEGSAKNSEST